MSKMTSIKNYIAAHKIMATAVGIGLLYGGYWEYGRLTAASGETHYVTAPASKGTLIVATTGSGQVAASDQVDIKPKASGDITWAGVTLNQTVSQGQALFNINDTDIKKQISDAELAVSDEKDNYDQVHLDAEQALNKSYLDGYSAVSTSFFKLTGYMQDLQDTLGTAKSENVYVNSYKTILGDTNYTFIQKLLDDYAAAKDLYNKNVLFFQGVSQGDNRDTVYLLINNTLNTTTAISQALESARHMNDAMATAGYSQYFIASTINTMQPKIVSDVSSVYSQISSLQSIKDSIDTTVKNTPKEIATAQKALQDKQDALDKLNQTHLDYTVRAPFNGVIAKINSKNGDAVSSGTTLATIITRQNIVQVTLNEVDVAKIKLGQKVSLTFDAIPDLTITGKVSEIDSIATVSQGVVTYTVKIGFDLQDARVKNGMSASASIITAVKQDVLLVPNSAIKLKGSTYYVNVLDQNAGSQSNQGITSPALPVEKNVGIGLSDDNSTEIISGLNEGDNVVIRTISGTSVTASATQAPSILSSLGTRITGGGAGGAARSFTRPAGN